MTVAIQMEEVERIARAERLVNHPGETAKTTRYLQSSLACILYSLTLGMAIYLYRKGEPTNGATKHVGEPFDPEKQERNES